MDNATQWLRIGRVHGAQKSATVGGIALTRLGTIKHAVEDRVDMLVVIVEIEFVFYFGVR